MQGPSRGRTLFQHQKQSMTVLIDLKWLPTLTRSSFENEGLKIIISSLSTCRPGGRCQINHLWTLQSLFIQGPLRGRTFFHHHKPSITVLIDLNRFSTLTRSPFENERLKIIISSLSTSRHGGRCQINHMWTLQSLFIQGLLRGAQFSTSTIPP